MLFEFFCLLLYIIGDVSNSLLNNLNSCSDLIYNDNLNDILIANIIPVKFYSKADVLKQKIMFENKKKNMEYIVE